MGRGGGFARRIPSSLWLEPIRCPYARAVWTQWLEDGVCVRKSGSSERVAYGPKPRENALSRVLSAPHSPDDFDRMDDGAVGGNPLNGAFPGVQSTLPPASPTPHPLSSYPPRNKTPWRPLSERLRGILYCGSHSQFGGGAVLAGGSSRNLFRDHAGQLLPAGHTGLPSNPAHSACLPCCPPSVPAMQSGRVCGGSNAEQGARGPSESPAAPSAMRAPKSGALPPLLGGVAIFS